MDAPSTNANASVMDACGGETNPTQPPNQGRRQLVRTSLRAVPETVSARPRLCCVRPHMGWEVSATASQCFTSLCDVRRDEAVSEAAAEGPTVLLLTTFTRNDIASLSQRKKHSQHEPTSNRIPRVRPAFRPSLWTLPAPRRLTSCMTHRHLLTLLLWYLAILCMLGRDRLGGHVLYSRPLAPADVPV